MIVRDFDDSDDGSICVPLDCENQSPLLIQAKRSLASSLALQLLEPHSFLGIQVAFVARRIDDRDGLQKRIDYLSWISLATAACCVKQLKLWVGEAKSHVRIIAASPLG